MIKILFVALLIFTFSALHVSCCEADSLVKLSIVIKGEGRVSVSESSPYSKGQSITLSFFPSGGNEFVTKPDVPTTFECDSNYGWVFDHWSFSDFSEQELSGLENPLTITINSDQTIYVSFINFGTNGHPTEKQFSQLMQIAKGNFIEWQSISDSQREALFRKSEFYLSDFITFNQKWGQPTTVWWKDFSRKTPLGYDYLGEGTTWAGLVLQALALKHKIMPDDSATIHNILEILNALSINVKIAGTVGRVARFSGPADDDAYRWYYEKVKVGAHIGVDPWQNMIWLGKPTRDTHTGLFTGLSSIGYFCRNNEEIYELAKNITENVIDRLLLDKWKIMGFDTDPPVKNEKSLKQLQMRTAYFFNPNKYSSFRREIESYKLNLSKGKELYDENYWVEWMIWAKAFGIILLETSHSKRVTQIKKINSLYAKKELHLNSYYTGITAYLNNLTDNDIISLSQNKILQAELEGILLSYPDGIKWSREIDLFQDSRFSFYNQRHVKESALPNQRVNADFNAQRSAARAKGGNNKQAYQYTNFDMFLMYWLARASMRL